MSDEALSAAELTYLEMTAKHAPNELPGSSAVVLRLVQELLARGEPEEVAEPLQAQIDDLQDRITQLELDHKEEVRKLTEEKTELQHEIEKLQEQLENADDTCPLC